MLAEEANHRAGVPDGVAGEEPAVDHGRVLVVHDRGGHVPALPARLRGAVVQVDVLAVHAEAGVEAADLVEHRAPEEEERREHRVRLRGLLGPLVEEVVLALPAAGREEQAQGRPADERRADRREAAAGGLPRAVGIEHPRARDAAARTAHHELAQDRDRLRLRHRIRVRDHDVLAARRPEALIRVGREGEGPRVLEHAGPIRNGPDAPGHVRDDHELLHLPRERRHRPLELARVAMRDHDGRDAHPSSSRYTASVRSTTPPNSATSSRLSASAGPVEEGASVRPNARDDTSAARNEIPSTPSAFA